MIQDFIPIQFDKSHLSMIGERMYTRSLDLVRELVANAIDSSEDSLTVEDNGLGMDREGLKQYFTIGSKSFAPFPGIFLKVKNHLFFHKGYHF